MPSARASTSGRTPEHPASSFRFHPFSPSNTTEALRAGNFPSHRLGTPVFARISTIRTKTDPPGRRSFPSPTDHYPPTAKISLPCILPKRSANRHVFSPTVTGTRGGREPQPSFIVNFPAPSVPDTVPPCTQGKRSGSPRRSPLLYTSHGETGTIRSSVVIPPRLRLPRKKVESPRHKKSFRPQVIQPRIPLLFRHPVESPTRPTYRADVERRSRRAKRTAPRLVFARRTHEARPTDEGTNFSSVR